MEDLIGLGEKSTVYFPPKNVVDTQYVLGLVVVVVVAEEEAALVVVLVRCSLVGVHCSMVDRRLGHWVSVFELMSYLPGTGTYRTPEALSIGSQKSDIPTYLVTYVFVCLSTVYVAPSIGKKSRHTLCTRVSSFVLWVETTT